MLSGRRIKEIVTQLQQMSPFEVHTLIDDLEELRRTVDSVLARGQMTKLDPQRYVSLRPRSVPQRGPSDRRLVWEMLIAAFGRDVNKMRRYAETSVIGYYIKSAFSVSEDPEDYAEKITTVLDTQFLWQEFLVEFWAAQDNIFEY